MSTTPDHPPNKREAWTSKLVAVSTGAALLIQAIAALITALHGVQF